MHMATTKFDQMLIMKRSSDPFCLLIGSIYLASTDHPNIITVANINGCQFQGKMDSITNYFLSGDLKTFYEKNIFIFIDGPLKVV